MTLFTSLLDTPVYVGKTEFSMRPSLEHLPLDPWTAQHATPTWTLLDGPPYANGSLHLGHVRNKLLKDTVVRANAAKGHSVSWRGGWDCHGLPVERNVEALGFTRHNPQEFVKHARGYAMEQTLLQKEQLKKLGTSNDLENAYRTMDFKQQADTLRVFARMVDNGHVYQAYKPVAWCHECQSTVASFESEDAELSTNDLYFAVHLDDDTWAYVWTTQAWSLYGHDALLVNPDAQYNLYEVTLNDTTRQMWLEDTCAQVALDRMNPTVCRKLKSTMGSNLVGLGYTLPWTTHGHSVYATTAVQSGAGTGWLHASAACSEDDYVSLTQLEAPMPSLANPPMHTSGLMVATNKPFWLTHNDVCTYYSEHDSFTKVEKVKRLRAHCWRHKVALTTRPSPQWYVRLNDSVRQRAVDRVEQVTFTPENGKDRLLAAVQNRPDWCVSRQRTWGVPVALYANKNGDLAPFAVEFMYNLADQVQEHGTKVLWDAVPVQGEYTLCMDVLDVWFDSGACFLTTTTQTPDVVVEGHDQFRGWFQSALWVSAVLDERLPYKHVVTHGFVLAKPGSKLSKSSGGDNVQKNNQVPPWQEVHPDVLRVWATQGAVGNDKFWNKEAYDYASSAYAKWRNTLRFVAANVPTVMPACVQLLDAEQWMVTTTHNTSLKVLEHWSKGQTEEAFDLLQTLCVHTLSNHAFSMLKDRLYCGTTDERASAQYALAQVGASLLRVLGCVLPTTLNEARPFLPQWLVASTNNTPEPEHLHWLSWLSHRETTANLWSTLSVKGRGSSAWANVELPVGVKQLESEDTLQWLGTTMFTYGSVDALTVNAPDHVEQCPRCRMVSALTCERCTARFKKYTLTLEGL